MKSPMNSKNVVMDQATPPRLEVRDHASPSLGRLCASPRAISSPVSITRHRIRISPCLWSPTPQVEEVERRQSNQPNHRQSFRLLNPGRDLPAPRGLEFPFDSSPRERTIGREGHPMTDMVVPSVLLDVLRKLHARLGDKNLNWALVGSFGLAIRGAPVEPKDVDVMTDRTGAYRIGQLFSDSVTSPVSFRSSDTIESHFGELNVDGVKVEIMGDFRIRLQSGGWHGPPDFGRFKETISVESMSIPVLSLEWEYDSYSRLGRIDRAEMVRGLLLSARKKRS